MIKKINIQCISRFYCISTCHELFNADACISFLYTILCFLANDNHSVIHVKPLLVCVCVWGGFIPLQGLQLVYSKPS